ncbi:MAG TPA: hypothetical protein VIJ68_04960 [Candidatus Saccharimonadales bacterium]
MNEVRDTISDDNDGFSKLDIARVSLKVARVSVKRVVRHPTMTFVSPFEIFGVIGAEKLNRRQTRRESIGDKVFVDLAHYSLTHEIGPEQHRLYLVDHLAEIRYEHGLPPDMPVSAMKEASKDF